MAKQTRTAAPSRTFGDGGSVELTGGDVVALVLAQHGVETVLAYPGTSEIGLCDAVARITGVGLAPGRGDPADVGAGPRGRSA